MRWSNFWRHHKAAHWIDTQTKSVSITLPVRANLASVRMRLALHMQFTQLGDVGLEGHPTRVDRKFFPIEVITLQDALAHVALALVILLTLIELCELYNDGLIGYITSVWNMLDIACYVLFCIVYQQYFVMRVAELGNNCNGSYVCEQIGNADNWEEMRPRRVCGRRWRSFTRRRS